MKKTNLISKLLDARLESGRAENVREFLALDKLIDRVATAGETITRAEFAGMLEQDTPNSATAAWNAAEEEQASYYALDAWGNRVKLYETIEAAKKAFVAANGEQACVSLIVAVDRLNDHYYAVLPEGRGTNCYLTDLGNVYEWFEPEWYDYVRS